VIIKATEGSGWRSQYFGGNLQRARDAGRLVAAYHYVRADSSAADQVANVRAVVPLDVPVIPDVEANSGDIALANDIVNRLRGAGYTVPFLYLPRWYWQQIGSPSLAGLPPLWSSHYPDNIIGSLPSEWAQVPASYWSGYGGLPVGILQFTSSASVGGRAPLDANAFQGTRDELAAQFHQGVNDVNLTDRIPVTNGTSHLPDVTVGEALGRIMFELTFPIESRATINRDPKNTDTLLGRSTSADGNAWDNAQRLNVLAGKVDALGKTPVPVALTPADLDALAAKIASQNVDAIAEKVADKIAARMVQ
jgi:hypothetical protein